MKAFTFWGWAVLVAAATGFTMNLWSGDRRYEVSSEPMKTIVTGNHIIEVPDEVTITAAGSRFFTLWNPETGEAITAKPADPPLGWEENYLVAGPRRISGTWVVEKGGSVHIELTSEIPTTVVVGIKAESRFWFRFLQVSIGVLVWLGGSGIAKGITKNC